MGVGEGEGGSIGTGKMMDKFEDIMMKKEKACDKGYDAI